MASQEFDHVSYSDVANASFLVFEHARPEDYAVDTIHVTDDEWDWITGHGQAMLVLAGRDCDFTLIGNGKTGKCFLEFRGSRLQCRRAQKYATKFLAGRTGEVLINEDDIDGDLTILTVSRQALNLFGKDIEHRSWSHFLRITGKETGVMMLFCEVVGDHGNEDFEKLAIFGELSARTCAAEKVNKFLKCVKMNNEIKVLRCPIVRGD